MRNAVCRTLLLSLLTASAAHAASRPATRPAALIARDVPLDVFLDTLRDSVDGLNLSVNWPALEAVGVDRSAPVTLRLRNVTTRRALDLALRQVGEGRLAWYVSDGVVIVTARDLADRAMITRVYPVGDLVVEVPDFAGPTVNFGNVGGGQSGSNTSIFDGGQRTADRNEASRAARGERLAELVRTLIRPEVWIESGGVASIRYFAGNLVVTAPRDVHDQLAR